MEKAPSLYGKTNSNKFKRTERRFPMDGEDYSYQAGGGASIQTKLRDLEEKYRILKDRVLLIGQNLIEMKENSDKKILEIKKDLEILKTNTERLASFMESASEEFSKFARKEDVELLYKQAKMFRPFDNPKRSNQKN